MGLKGTKLYSVLTGTCPHCQKSKVFIDSAPYKSMNFDQVNNKCSYCGQSFQPEPGFYQGAMYVSYALTMALAALVAAIAFVWVENASVWAVAGVVLGLIILLLPIISRLSRIIWLNIFVDFDENIQN